MDDLPEAGRRSKTGKIFLFLLTASYTIIKKIDPSMAARMCRERPGNWIHEKNTSHLERPLSCRSDVLLNGLEVRCEIKRRPEVDDVVDAHEVTKLDGAVAGLVVSTDELLRRADDAVLGGHDERRHGHPGHRRIGHHAVLDALEQPVCDDLELLAEVDYEGVGHGLDLDPFALVRDVEAVDLAWEQEGDEVPVAVRRQAERLVGVGARRVVVDVEDNVAVANVAVEVVGSKPHAFA
jgi:hypothetical protein